MNQRHESDRGGPRIPPGRYVAELVSATLEFSPVKGTPQVRIVLRITEGPYAGELLTGFLYFTERTIQRTQEQLALLGVRLDLERQDIVAIDGEVRRVEVVVDHEETPDGRVFARVRWINKAPRTMTAEERAALVREVNKKPTDEGGGEKPMDEGGGKEPTNGGGGKKSGE